MQINVFNQIYQVFWTLFLQIFFLTSSVLSHYTYVGMLDIVPTSLWGSVHNFQKSFLNVIVHLLKLGIVKQEGPRVEEATGESLGGGALGP